MDSLRFDPNQTCGTFKVMHAVNNGPCHKRHANDQYRSNFETFKAARIPYARNHDASFCQDYGSEHTVDITAIFPQFEADPYDPASYDFAVTDEYILITQDAGTETFYRLGQKIEHYVKKYGTIPPSDFKKWAIVCEHIIRHYNEGWADGYNLNIQYWEIWNEADLDDEDSTNKRTWGGTKEQFFDLYSITAKHLKTCFPHLKIGGPALAWRYDWAEDFLREMKRREVAIDFFSWHVYCRTPEEMIERAEKIKCLLVETGYGDAESICNEWNYIKGWTDEFIYSIESIIGIKGAAFTMACMTVAQQSSIDMLMYYDARPGVFNGLFDYYTMRPLKGYYPFVWYSKLYDLKAELRSETKIDNIYSLCGCDADGKLTAVITYYTDDDTAAEKTVSIDFGKDAEYEICLLDKDHDGESAGVVTDLTFTMKANTCILIEEK